MNAVDWQISYFEDVFYHTICICVLCCPFPVQYKFGTFKQNCVHFGTISQPNGQLCLDTARSQKSQLWLGDQGHFGGPKSWLNPKKVTKVEVYVIFAFFVFCGWGAKTDFKNIFYANSPDRLCPHFAANEYFATSEDG